MRRQKIWEILGISWWWLMAATWGEEALRGAIHFESLQVLSVLSIWGYIQAMWLKRAMPTSKALYWYLATDAIGLLAEVFNHFHRPIWGGIPLVLLLIISYIVSVFVFRSEFEGCFNQDASPWLQIRLSRWMTLFFNVLYFQYHFQQQYKEQRDELLSVSHTSLD